ncbi:MAG: hypothetical protein COY40_06175 [Alphaproteobacteria bacterium CG_4_10_14_0_8_um_filter_53_9]|nr:MAG: hypothetical protein COY40_06175 [Alphaproteobacteria bacterium CG_4_10_14_0_8_um_filter_53_9]
MRFLVFSGLCSALILGAFSCWAQPQQGYPRYASLKRAEVNVRSGPGNQYPILWIYQRAGYPVQLLAKFDNYYKIKDVEGEEGWVYLGLVSLARTSFVLGDKPSLLLRRKDTSSDIVAKLSPGVIVDLVDCDTKANMCKVETQGLKGWMETSSLLWAASFK